MTTSASPGYINFRRELKIGNLQVFRIFSHEGNEKVKIYIFGKQYLVSTLKTLRGCNHVVSSELEGGL